MSSQKDLATGNASPAARASRVSAANTHPSDEALAALLDEGVGDSSSGAAEAATRQHVAGCPICGRRLAELRALRQALKEAAPREATLPRDLARVALARLRHRESTVSRLNELVTMLVGFVRGLATLLAEPGPNQNPAGRSASGQGSPASAAVASRPTADTASTTGAAGAVGGSRG